MVKHRGGTGHRVASKAMRSKATAVRKLRKNSTGKGKVS